ncbi:GerW family sporulation protein [Natrinema salaciae]|uniref:Sporulation protein YtfJ (Spore_YtfJ) n=1 Tax=Natrinema salaciae TaxID=1186196 RepID=A0A1H9G5R2_9EURY|nr:spore germination protein GerW family protein [Natrinema salaciae]SEQ45422.1 Sporulation protein YtfJ (Spore_YtfJ) [Natrinema salaciae]
MNDGKGFTSVISRLQESATVESVYGRPIESNGKTIIPVTKIRYGFGGGYGTDSDGDEHREDADDEDRESTGAGMGGGVIATPTAIVEITDSETRVIPTGSNTRLAAVALVCLGLGYLVGRINPFGR